MYISTKMQQTTTPVQIQIATTTDNYGVRQKAYQSVAYTSWCNWTDYSGSEKDINNISAAEESATLYFRWFDSNAKTDGRIIRLTDNAVFEIVSVENIEQRDKAMIVRVRRIKGGA